MIQPPLFARSLLQVFLPEPERDNVLGDLLEEYQHNPSGAWYWSQVLRSLSHLTWMGVRRAPWRTAGAMLAGYTGTVVSVMATFILWERFGGPEAGLVWVEMVGGFFCAALGGYTAACVSRGTGITGLVALSLFTGVMGAVSLAFEPVWHEAALLGVFLAGILVGGYWWAWRGSRTV